MQVKGIEGMTIEQLAGELERGGRFVVFQYCISVLILTFKQGSAVYFVRADESAFVKGIPYTLLSMITGWWGFPWGPIFTIWTLAVNFSGGKDVTREIVAAIQLPDSAPVPTSLPGDSPGDSPFA